MEVMLRKADRSDIPLIVSMQRKAFFPLYEIYRDDGSPALESEEKVAARFEAAGSGYYLIEAAGAAAGAVRVQKKENNCRISPIFILPAYQNMGIGSRTLKMVENLYPETERWELDTIKEEVGNCYFYEKAGYQRVGEEHPVNERLTLVKYEKYTRNNESVCNNKPICKSNGDKVSDFSN